MLSGSGSLTSARLASNESEAFESRLCGCAEQPPLPVLVLCPLPHSPRPSPTSCLSISLLHCFLRRCTVGFYPGA